MHIDLLKEVDIARATANDILGQSTDEVIDGAEAAARLAKHRGSCYNSTGTSSSRWL